MRVTLTLLQESRSGMLPTMPTSSTTSTTRQLMVLSTMISRTTRYPVISPWSVTWAHHSWLNLSIGVSTVWSTQLVKSRPVSQTSQSQWFAMTSMADIWTLAQLWCLGSLTEPPRILSQTHPTPLEFTCAVSGSTTSWASVAWQRCMHGQKPDQLPCTSILTLKVHTTGTRWSANLDQGSTSPSESGTTIRLLRQCLLRRPRPRDYLA